MTFDQWIQSDDGKVTEQAAITTREKMRTAYAAGSAEVDQLRVKMASPDGLLSYTEIRNRLLEREIENSGLKLSLNLIAVERDRFAADAYRLRAEADQVKADSRRDATFRRTVDGITVTDGMRLFGVHLETKEVFEWRATVYYAFYEVRSIRNTDDFYVFHVQDCYSTREAAEAAKGAADGNVSPV